MIDDLIPIVVR